MIPVNSDEWMLANHRLHPQVKARKAAALREKAGWLARADLSPISGPLAVFARAYVRGGILPDADAIAPMVKPVIDGIVDAGIMPDDDGEHVYLVGYGRPARDRTLKPGMHSLMVVLTDQYVPF